MKVSNKIVLRFPSQIAEQPVVYRLVKEHNLQFNILRASIGPEEEGLMVLEIAGERGDYEGGMDLLRRTGVEVRLFSKEISRREDRCTHCGACVALCPAGAFVVEPNTRRVDFADDKCIACEICIKACPVRAMELRV